MNELFRNLRFTNKKEDRFSPEKARVLICRLSCHSLAIRSCPLRESYLLKSLQDRFHSAFLSDFLSFCRIIPTSTITVQSLRTYHAIRFKLRGIFTVFCSIQFPIIEVSFLSQFDLTSAVCAFLKMKKK